MSFKKVIVLICSISVSATVALGQAPAQPTVWASQPDVAGFEKIVNERLAAGQTALDKIVAVKGARTIENTLAVYDEAVRSINSAQYLASLVESVHPDAAFRDHGTAMVRKTSAAQTALSASAGTTTRREGVPPRRARRLRAQKIPPPSARATATVTIA